jgi:RNA polymerase sigma factor (sigma-70 family)
MIFHSEVNHMKWELATNDQLLTIIKDDIYCPTHLLSGVVDEMLKRNMFNNLIRKAIKRRFHLIEIACQKLCMNKEELLQILNIEIWERVAKYKQGKSPFGYFAYLAVYSKLRETERLFDFGRKKTLLYQSSMEMEVGENQRLEDCLPAKTNVEQMVIEKITFEEKISVLSPGEKDVFLLYVKGYSFTEIAEIIHLSKTGVNKRMKQALTKLSGKVINLKSLGINQYKVGA